MFNKLIQFIKREDASVVVENVIVLPLIFIVIFAFIMTAFIMHDRATLDAAAKRGAIYAAHCISDPNYANILAASGNQATADPDISKNVDGFEFGSPAKIGRNIKPYRYFTGSTTKQGDAVEKEVKRIVDSTSLKFFGELDMDKITYTNKNMVFYQYINVSIDAGYPLPKLFSAFGMPEEYTYTVNATMTVNDPDEFIRNADFVLDIINQLTHGKFGEEMDKVQSKISDIASKISDWIK